MTLLRVAIGWHFLYEGMVKAFAADWSAYAYLANSNGPLAGLYHSMAASPGMLQVVDFLNVYGLILIGLALFVGFLVRYAGIAGILLLALYYLAYPPFGASLMWSGDEHLYIVSRQFIEAAALAYLIISRDKGYGIDALKLLFKNKKPSAQGDQEIAEPANARREMLKNLAALPVLGVMGWGAFRANRKYEVDVMSGATLQMNKTSLRDLAGELPKGMLHKHKVSRLVMGGNLIGGWAHARDLLYAPDLFKAYNTETKIYETLSLGEKAGINAISVAHSSVPLMMKYKRMTGSDIQIISQVSADMEKKNYYDQINEAIDLGVDIVQILGNLTDWLVRDHNEQVIQDMLDEIRRQGYTAGLAAHTVDSFISLKEKGIIPDYYMKTMHHDNYWSAHPIENRVPFEVDTGKSPDHNRFHDNLFCLFPERTVKFVREAEVPVMGFKTLAAGAIHPSDGFNWAFTNGADFICVGMFDFQIVEDVNIAIDTLNNLKGRKRKWYG